MNISSNQIKQYFAKINCELLSVAYLNEAEQLLYLQKLFRQHVEMFPFHNFELRSMSKTHRLFRSPLTLFKMDDFLRGFNGGFCFQNTMLLYTALKEAGFSVFCSIAKVLNGLSPTSIDAKKIPSTHLILVVNIGSDKYLIDPSMAMSGHTAPLLLQQKDQNYIQNNHQFKIENTKEGFILSRRVSQDWTTVFCSWLKIANFEMIKSQLAKLEYYPGILGIRDLITLIGIGTPTGGKSLLWDPKNKHFVLKTITSTEDDKELVIKDLDQIYSLLCSDFKINHISKSELEYFCLENLCIKPKRSIEVDFPIDSYEISKLKNYFNY